MKIMEFPRLLPARLACRSSARAVSNIHSRSRYLLPGRNISSTASHTTVTSNASIASPVVSAAQTSSNVHDHTFPARLERIRSAPSFSSFLTDSFSRQHNYLRISITERCNLRCTYCMPEEGVPLSPPSDNLTTPEILLLSELFVSQGVDKIRLTGGEPTIRKDFLDLAQRIGSLRSRGLKELCITTNGVSLWRKLDALADAGLTGVNLSLDTLDPHLFQIMTRRRGFDAVMKSMDRILELKKLGAPIKLKINSVVMRGVNDHEILPFVELGREKDIEVRFIEYMPFDGNKWARKKMFSYEEMLATIRSRYPDVARLESKKGETSKTWQVPGFVGKVGFITSMTENFCGTCNRLRITSDGNLKVCLFGNAEVSLRDLLREENEMRPIDEEVYEAMREIEEGQKLRSDGSPAVLSDVARERQLLEVIGKAVGRKKAKHAGMGELENMPNRPMILIDELQQCFQAALKRRNNQPGNTSRRPSKITDTPVPKMGLSDGNTDRTGAWLSPTRSSLVGHALKQSTSVSSLQERLYSSTPKKAPQSALSAQSTQNNPAEMLPHLTVQSTAHMVSISSKPVTRRTATAVGTVVFSNDKVLPAVRSHLVRKGDVLATARIAGIMGAKRCADIVPLCHPGLGIEHVNVDVEAVGSATSAVQRTSNTNALFRDNMDFLKEPLGKFGGVRIAADVVCEGKTGIEMEAFTAVMAAAVTVVDMCKALDKGLVISDVKLVMKEGGRSGLYIDKDWATVRS